MKEPFYACSSQRSWELLCFSYLNLSVVIWIVVNVLNSKQVTVFYLPYILAKFLIFNFLRN